MLSKQAEAELYSFIVDSNLEQSLLKQLNDKNNKKELAKWLQVEE